MISRFSLNVYQTRTFFRKRLVWRYKIMDYLTVVKYSLNYDTEEEATQEGLIALEKRKRKYPEEELPSKFYN